MSVQERGDRATDLILLLLACRLSMARVCLPASLEVLPSAATVTIICSSYGITLKSNIKSLALTIGSGTGSSTGSSFIVKLPSAASTHRESNLGLKPLKQLVMAFRLMQASGIGAAGLVAASALFSKHRVVAHNSVTSQAVSHVYLLVDHGAAGGVVGPMRKLCDHADVSGSTRQDEHVAASGTLHIQVQLQPVNFYMNRATLTFNAHGLLWVPRVPVHQCAARELIQEQELRL